MRTLTLLGILIFLVSLLLSDAHAKKDNKAEAFKDTLHIEKVLTDNKSYDSGPIVSQNSSKIPTISERDRS